MGVTASIKSSSSTESTADLEKQLSNSKTSTTNQSIGTSERPPAGGPRVAPPKELRKSDLEQIKNKISQSGAEGSDKIDDLIANFDQYDNGSGKISIED